MRHSVYIRNVTELKALSTRDIDNAVKWKPASTVNWTELTYIHTLLVGKRKGIRPVKRCVIVCCWWRLDWSYARLTAPVVTTTSIILSSNKIQNENILVSANPGPPGKIAVKMEWENALVIAKSKIQYKSVKNSANTLCSESTLLRKSWTAANQRQGYVHNSHTYILLSQLPTELNWTALREMTVTIAIKHNAVLTVTTAIKHNAVVRRQTPSYHSLQAE